MSKLLSQRFAFFIYVMSVLLFCLSLPQEISAFAIAKPSSEGESQGKPMSVRGHKVVHRPDLSQARHRMASLAKEPAKDEKQQSRSHSTNNFVEREFVYEPVVSSADSQVKPLSVRGRKVVHRPDLSQARHRMASIPREPVKGGNQQNLSPSTDGFIESEFVYEPVVTADGVFDYVTTEPDESDLISRPVEYGDNQYFYEPIEFEDADVYEFHDSFPNEEYRLKVGDAFLISVYGEEKTEREVVVDPRGMISYLFVGPLPAAGRTIAEVREDIADALRRYFRYVKLAITPIKFSAEYYAVMGQVNEAGRQPIIGRPTLLSALCKAQGFSVIDYRDQIFDMCDLEKSFLARKGHYVPVDFNQLVRHGDLNQDVPLEAGDFIYVHNRTINRVYVVGEVLNPISIDYFNDISLIEAIAEAGDVLERASSRVLVLRGSLSCPVRYLIDYSRIVKGCYPDFKLQPGDIVYVPPRKLYLAKEIFRLALAAFVATVAYETGIEIFIQSHPDARQDLGDRTFVPGGVIVP